MDRRSLHKTSGTLIGWQLWAVLIFGLQATFSFADVAVLREKGPWSGSLFSNPGILAGKITDLKVAMLSADVKIHLRRGQGDQLAADCEADFVLDDRSDTSAGSREFLVAFPVSGLSSNIITVSDFVVVVKGERPATVLRQTIFVSKRNIETKDSAVYGQLDAKFQPTNSHDGFGPVGVVMASERVYRDAYVWLQKSTAGKKTPVHITYTVSIRPQTIHYSKSYAWSPNDSEVIPFDDISVDQWDQPYYFFDYVLMSGSTWDGPIGREKIALSIDPALGLNPNRVQSEFRHPVGFSRNQDDPASHGGGMEDSESFKNGGLQWTFEGKPTSDLLLAIPVSAVGHSRPELKR